MEFIDINIVESSKLNFSIEAKVFNDKTLNLSNESWMDASAYSFIGKDQLDEGVYLLIDKTPRGFKNFISRLVYISSENKLYGPINSSSKIEPLNSEPIEIGNYILAGKLSLQEREAFKSILEEHSPYGFMLSTNPRDNFRGALKYLQELTVTNAILDFYYAFILYYLRDDSNYRFIALREFSLYEKRHPASPLVNRASEIAQILKYETSEFRINKKEIEEIHILLGEQGELKRNVFAIFNQTSQENTELFIYDCPNDFEELRMLKFDKGKECNDTVRHFIFIGHGSDINSNIIFNNNRDNVLGLSNSDLFEKLKISRTLWKSVIYLSCNSDDWEEKLPMEISYLVKHNSFFPFNSIFLLFDYTLTDLTKFDKYEDFFSHAKAVSFMLNESADDLELVP